MHLHLRVLIYLFNLPLKQMLLVPPLPQAPHWAMGCRAATEFFTMVVA